MNAWLFANRSWKSVAQQQCNVTIGIEQGCHVLPWVESTVPGEDLA
jgi:hypothetical protein